MNYWKDGGNINLYAQSGKSSEFSRGGDIILQPGSGYNGAREGRVGIGTTNPTSSLEINGIIYFNLSGGNPGLWIHKGDAGVTNSTFRLINTQVGSANRLSVVTNIGPSISGKSEKLVRPWRFRAAVYPEPKAKDLGDYSSVLV